MGQQLAKELEDMLNKWYSIPQVSDERLSIEIMNQKIEILERIIENKQQMFRNYRDRIYFPPSSAGSDPRELYVKAKKAKKDKEAIPAHKGRWRSLGEITGDMIQTALLFIEKHYEKKTGEKPAFIPCRTDEGYPMWEDFADKFVEVEHNGEKFWVKGKPDGVLLHQKTGKRIGLEIKTKQTTHSKTSLYSLPEAEPKHKQQCFVYSIPEMFDLDEYLILYVNLSKKSWEMNDSDIKKSPDLRCFHIDITEEDKNSVLDVFSEVVKSIRSNTPPALDLSRWTFNNYKTACALSLTDDEYYLLKAQVKRAMRSGLPEWKKQGYYDAFEFIREVREDIGGGNDDKGEAI